MKEWVYYDALCVFRSKYMMGLGETYEGLIMKFFMWHYGKAQVDDDIKGVYLLRFRCEF